MTKPHALCPYCQTIHRRGACRASVEPTRRVGRPPKAPKIPEAIRRTAEHLATIVTDLSADQIAVMLEAAQITSDRLRTIMGARKKRKLERQKLWRRHKRPAAPT